MKKHLPLALLSVLAISCGGSGGSGGSGSSAPGGTIQEESAILDGSNIQGTYLAQLNTMNPHVNGTIPASVTITRNDDKMMVYARLFAGGVQAWHPQYVYTGTRCPAPSDDTNADGYVDIVEANNVLGNILIPLDSDLNSQKSGMNFFPLGDLSGSYFYERTASFRRFFTDLKSADSNETDNMVKLRSDEGLDLVGRAVMILGVADTVELPETVQTLGRRKAGQMLPIACGTFRQVTEEPGTPDDGRIPGPVAPVEDGQDHPAPAGAGEVDGTPGSTNGTGTNSSGSGNYGSGDGDGNTNSSSTPPPPTSSGSSTSGSDYGSDENHNPWWPF